MPPKRKHRRRNTNPATTGAGAGPMADCVFPQHIMVCILTRLPVKSILRFKSVCKPWRKLFATPWFVKLHHDQFSEKPQNQSVIISSLSHYHGHTMTLFEIESDDSKLINLHHPYPDIFLKMDFVGCCNGLLCMGFPPLGKGIVLWNPAMKLFKFVRLSKVEFGVVEMVSLGFGYDPEGGDFKVVRIVCLEGKEMKRKKKKEMKVGVEVYSCNSDSWKTIKVGFQFRVLWTTNDAIVNGNPYWIAKVVESDSASSDPAEVLLCFNVKKMVFEIVPLSGYNLRDWGEVPLVNWNGSIATLVCDKNSEMVKSVDIWVFDDGGKIWRKNHTFGPIELKVDRFLQCSKSGKILGECPDGKLFAFDPDNGGVKMIVIDETRKRSFEIYGYTESLACVKGMEKVPVKNQEHELEFEDGDEDDADLTAAEIELFLMSYLHLL